MRHHACDTIQLRSFLSPSWPPEGPPTILQQIDNPTTAIICLSVYFIYTHARLFAQNGCQ